MGEHRGILQLGDTPPDRGGSPWLLPDTLQVPIVDWKECEANTNMDGMTIDNSMLCAGGEGKATCKVAYIHVFLLTGLLREIVEGLSQWTAPWPGL